MIVCRKPEITHFYIFVLDLAVFRPKGRILSGFCFDSHHREVFPVYPDCPTIKKFVLGLWLDRDCVQGIILRCAWLKPEQLEGVILAVECRKPLMVFPERLLLRLQ